MNEKSLLLRLTGELPLFKILDFLVDNKGLDFTKKDIAQGADISKASLFNYLESNNFEKNKIEELYRIFRSERDGNKVQNSNIIIKTDIEKLLSVYEKLLKDVNRLLK